MDTVRRITALLRELPPAGTPAVEQADWFERKAAVFDAIAVENPHLAGEAVGMARAARDRAAQLRTSTGSDRPTQSSADPADGGALCR